VVAVAPVVLGSMELGLGWREGEEAGKYI